jgi:formate hydrogenlyase subunit 3/multisubunit Na+/H+ antiporter MnhD subunit
MLIPSLVLMALLLMLNGGDRRELGERLGFAAALVASTLAVLFYTVCKRHLDPT